MLHKALHTLLRFLVSPCRISLVWVPWVLCIGGFVLSQCLLYPGFVSWNALNQFTQIEEGIVHDWHPPIMAVTWQGIREGYKAITGTNIPGHGILWTLFTSWICGGLLLILLSGRLFWNNKGSSQKTFLFLVITLFLLLWSLIDVYTGLIWLQKDTGFLGAYLMATGCLFNLPKRKWGQVLVGGIALFFIFYGTALRHNAVFAAIPLILWLIWSFVESKKLAVIIPCGIAVWLAMLGSIHYLNYEVIKAVRSYSIREIFYSDFFQLNARTSRYVLPPNTFGNDFSTLDKAIFRKKFNKDELYIRMSFLAINEIRSDTYAYSFTDSATPYSLDNRDGEKFREQFEARQKRANTGFAFEHRYLPKNVTAVRNQYPKDYVTLRSAWIERVLMDPMTYIKFKTHFFRKFCKDNTLNFMGINAMLLLPFLLVIVGALTFFKKVTSPSVFPCLMLAWSALLTILPLWAFLPDAHQIRYLYWFFAASFIAIVYFCSQSKLFNELVQTIQRYLEEKVNAGSTEYGGE